MKTKTLVVFLLCSIPLFSCSGRKNSDEPTSQIGKYIYLDDNGIYHINSKCVKLMLTGKDDDGHDIYAKYMIDTLSFTESQYFRVCVRCVNDEEYEHLLRISENNLKY